MKNKAMERRQHPRFLAGIKANCFHVLSDGTSEKATVKVTGVWSRGSGKPQTRGIVRDVSFGGLYLESVRDFREGTILVIELQLPRKKARIVVIGLVRWTKSVRNDPPFRHGFGIQFIYMQKADWLQLQKLFKDIKPTILPKSVARKVKGKRG